MKFLKFAAIGVLVLPLFSCGPSGSRQEGGTVIGAVAGGVIGNQFGSGSGRILATAAGAVVGGLIGSSIGKDLDEADRQAAIEAEYRALEYEEEARWRNEESGNYGYIKPRRSFRRSGADCREYEHTVYIEGEPDPQIMVGTACRNRDGTWEAVS